MASVSNRLNAPLDRIAVGMILLALGSAAFAAVGRGDVMDEVKLPVRYTMFTSALHVGLLCLVLPRLGRRFQSSGERLFQNALGLTGAFVLLVLQIFVGRSAAHTAAAIAQEADCFAEGIGVRQASHVISPRPEAAQAVLIALRKNGLLSPRAGRCAVSAN
jgi:hypothetical protein